MRRSSTSVVRFAATLLLVSVAYFAVMYRMTRPRLDSVDGPEPFFPARVEADLSLDPSAEIWSEVAPTTVHLLPQTVRAPRGTEEFDILVRAAFNQRELAFLLEFEDPTENRGEDPRPDGCAVLLTPRPAPAATQMMGHGGEANIWHWVAASSDDQGGVVGAPAPGARELAASGPGTQAPMPLQRIEGRGLWTDGVWRVVLKRTLDRRQAGELAVADSVPLAIAFAVWDGSRLERLSAKSISVLRPFVMDRD